MEPVKIKPEGYILAFYANLTALGILIISLIPIFIISPPTPSIIILFLITISILIYNLSSYYKIMHEEYELREDGILIKTGNGKRIIPYTAIRKIRIRITPTRYGFPRLGDIILEQDGKKRTRLYSVQQPESVKRQIEEWMRKEEE